ncbi:MAG: bifunctional indole-3-glycerol-phosphate synthase TrpC/phosphoribosylanthranilate isomerase TrpF [Psychromonas sp.]|nr:bifunctional indole-3-glycerol-phosphate synthase TrpC/phosphoribosylanthranilate isomerase TrpF [Psychromonas sp.]
MLNNESLQETILDKIVDNKLLWIAKRKKIQPLISFKDNIINTDRDFYNALNQTHSVFILECKKASPSQGLIREDFDLDLIAGVYKNHADVISVLTDEKYFQGNLEFVTKIRENVTQPVLCKDFIIDSYQIYLARYYQADAILLMLSVLDDDAYKAYRDTAHSLNMGVLTEVSNEEERLRAIALNAKVIGINNRNLRDLSIDLNRTKTLALDMPTERIIISESGIYTHSQVKDLSQYVNGFLVGSSIMSQDNIEFACRRLILGENKVCGLTDPKAAQDVYLAGAIYGGLIFVEKSKRCIDIEQAQKIIQAAPLIYVGVFQNETPKRISHIVQKLGLSAVQLHGDESPNDIQILRTLLPTSCMIWKAHGISNKLPDIEKYNVDKHILDTRSGDQSGGTGKTFDWSLFNEANIDKDKLILAGGLSPENAQQASLIGCAGLDFNSGLESTPGIKETQKINAVFSIIKKYSQRDKLQRTHQQSAQKV